MDDSFYRVYTWMTKDLGLRGTERDLFALIYGYTETCGEFAGSLTYLSENLGTAKSTVVAALHRLIKKGLLLKRDFIKNGVRYCA